MAEALQQADEPPIRRPIRVEIEPDGVVIVFIDPRMYKVQLINGRGEDGTRDLYTRVIISPWLDLLGTSTLSSYSRDTDLQK